MAPRAAGSLEHREVTEADGEERAWLAGGRQGRRSTESWAVLDGTQVHVCTTGPLTGVENLILLAFEPLQALDCKCVMEMKKSKLAWQLWK